MATITVGLMDPPYESANTVTGLRIVDAALRKGIHVNVFLYEGAVALGFADQKPHANPVKQTSVEQQAHPNPKDWVSGLLELARLEGATLNWVNCGLCVDERGVEKQVEGVRRGSPADFWKMAEASEGFLYIATR
jgi:tRNA 2-thiouridine synthesizing protein D